MSNFKLQPFPNANPLPEIELSGTIDRQNGMLSIGYRLSGDLSDLEIPLPAPLSKRKDRLWETTCFEFFLGIPGDRNYWEFNLSPAGDWNIFHLDDYRQSLRDELAVTSLPFTIDRQPNLLLLALEFDLSKLIKVERSNSLMSVLSRCLVSPLGATHAEGTSAWLHPLFASGNPTGGSRFLAEGTSAARAAASAIEVSITTVIKPRQGEISYWALTHCGAEADFHLRDSFIIRI